MSSSLAPLHMGQLHAYEHLLVYLLAFGPFVLLALTIWISRRRAPLEPKESDASTDHVTSGHPAPGE